MRMGTGRSLLVMAITAAFLVGFSLPGLAADTDTTDFDVVVTNPAVEWNDPSFDDIEVNVNGLQPVYATQGSFKVWSTSLYTIDVEVSRTFNAAWAAVLTNPFNPAVGSGSGLPIWRHARGFDIAVQNQFGTWSPLQTERNNFWSGLGSQLPTLFEPDLSRDHNVVVALVLREQDSVPEAGNQPTAAAGSGQPRFGSLPSGTYTVDVTVTVAETF